MSPSHLIHLLTIVVVITKLSRSPPQWFLWCSWLAAFEILRTFMNSSVKEKCMSLKFYSLFENCFFLESYFLCWGLRRIVCSFLISGWSSSTMICCSVFCVLQSTWYTTNLLSEAGCWNVISVCMYLRRNKCVHSLSFRRHVAEDVCVVAEDV
jgi:hypothetical protein